MTRIGWCKESFAAFYINILKDLKYSVSFSAVSHQHLSLVVTGLPCPGCGPLPRLRALLAAGLHHSCSQDECSHDDQSPPHGTRGRSDSHTGEGARSFSEMCYKCVLAFFSFLFFKTRRVKERLSA